MNNKNDYIEDLESALIDLLSHEESDLLTHIDITCGGISEERMQEIHDLYFKVIEIYKDKHKLNKGEN